MELGILGTDEEALCHNYFIASISRGSTVKLEAGVVIFSDYPNSIPLVTLFLQWKDVKTAATDQNIQVIIVALYCKLVRFYFCPCFTGFE